MRTKESEREMLGAYRKSKRSSEATPNERTWRQEGVVFGTAPDTLSLRIVKYGAL